MMEKDEIMGRFVEFMNQVVEEEKAKVSSNVNLESIGNWIETASEEDIQKLSEMLNNNEYYRNLSEDAFQQRIENDDYILKDDLDVDVVDDAGLLEDCFREYAERQGVKDTIIELLDDL